MNSFYEELQKRINPEKSRNFNTKFWEENLYFLKKIYNKIQTYFSIKPLKISVIGTNGKGTVAYFLTQILQQEKKTTGLYTSPHLITYRERIKINLEILEEDLLSSKYNEFLKFLSSEIPDYHNFFFKFTYFELLTIFAIYLFYNYKLEIQIYEAGLGGRLDATKIVEPEIVVLTYVRLDHTKILGNTYTKILQEKLGILSEKTKTLFVIEDKFKNQIQKYLKDNKDLKIYFYDQTKKLDYLENLKNFSIFCFETMISKKKESYQLSYPKGRREIHQIEEQFFCFDIAHNLSGLYYFLLDLKDKFSDLNQKNSIVFIGILKDRNYKHFYRLFRFTKIKEFLSEPFILNFPEFIHSNIKDNQIFKATTKKEFLQYTKNKKYIILCGSFRLYEFYYNLIQKSNEEIYEKF